MSDDRVRVMVEIKFVLDLPPGSEVPSPQHDAVISAALAIAGPCEIMPGSSVSVSLVPPDTESEAILGWLYSGPRVGGSFRSPRSRIMGY